MLWNNDNSLHKSIHDYKDTSQRPDRSAQKQYRDGSTGLDGDVRRWTVKICKSLVFNWALTS